MSAALIPLVRLEPANQPEPQLPDTATWAYQQYTARVRYDTGCLLGFEPNAIMTRRVAVLSIEGRPVLSSTSYLPVELVHDSAAWRRIELGRLAVVGYPVTAVGSWQVHGRAPTTMERSVLGIRASAEIPVAVKLPGSPIRFQQQAVVVIVYLAQHKIRTSTDHDPSCLFRTDTEAGQAFLAGLAAGPVRSMAVPWGS